MNIYQKTFNNFKTKKVFFPIGLDLLFLFMYGFIYSGILSKLAENLYVIQAQSIQKSLALTSVYNVIILFVIFIIFIFTTYTLIQGTAWWYVRPKYIPLKKYLKKFAQRNILLIILFLLYSTLQIIIGFLAFSEMKIPSILTPIKLIILSASILIFIMYSRIGQKKTKFFHKDHMHVLIIILLLFSINTITNPKIALPLGILVLLPGFTYLRIMLYTISKQK